MFYWDKAPIPFAYILSGAELQQKSGLVVTETTWPVNLIYLVSGSLRNSLLAPDVADTAFTVPGHAKGILLSAAGTLLLSLRGRGHGS